MIKTKLHRVYALFCPALLSGRFLTEGNIMQTPSAVTFAPPPADRRDRHHVGDNQDNFALGELGLPVSWGLVVARGLTGYHKRLLYIQQFKALFEF